MIELIELRSGTRLALTLTLASVLAVVLATRIAPLSELDAWWLDLMVSARISPVVTVARVLDVLGSPWITVPTRVGLIVLLSVWRRWRDAGFVALAWLLAAIGSSLVKIAVDRPRPPAGLRLTDVTSASFPSGHTIAIASIAATIVLVFLPPGRRMIGWAIVAVATALMAWSRTYLGAHWLSDVLAGAVIGITAAVDAAVLVTWWDGRREVRARPLSR